MSPFAQVNCSAGLSCHAAQSPPTYQRQNHTTLGPGLPSSACSYFCSSFTMTLLQSGPDMNAVSIDCLAEPVHCAASFAWRTELSVFSHPGSRQARSRSPPGRPVAPRRHGDIGSLMDLLALVAQAEANTIVVNAPPQPNATKITLGFLALR